MTWLIGISMLVFIGVCTAVGVRLLVLFRVTRGKAELYCGLGFLLTCLTGYPLAMASRVGQAPVGEMYLVPWAIGTASVYAGIGFLYAFTAIAFRGESRWSLLLTRLGALGSAIGYAGAFHTLLTAPPEQSSFEALYLWNSILQAVSFVGFGWTSFESFGQWRMSLRRVRLGLGEPMVANRFLLWGIYGCASLTLSGSFWIAQMLGLSPMAIPALHIAAGVLGATAGTALYMAFFPPAAYRRWVEARSARDAG